MGANDPLTSFSLFAPAILADASSAGAVQIAYNDGLAGVCSWPVFHPRWTA